MRYWKNEYDGMAVNIVGPRRGARGGAGGSWLQQMDKHCRVVAEVPPPTCRCGRSLADTAILGGQWMDRHSGQNKHTAEIYRQGEYVEKTNRRE